MVYIKFLIFYLFICNNHFSSAIIYACNRTTNNCRCSKYKANVYKTVGGEDAFPSSLGWAVSMQDLVGDHFYTGTIVSSQHIIAAAHCVTDADKMKIINVVVGIDRLPESFSETAQVFSLSAVFVYPDYNKSTQIHDIAVLQLNEPITIYIFSK